MVMNMWIKCLITQCGLNYNYFFSACSRKRYALEANGRLDVTLHCSSNGNYEEIQCDSGICWCADSRNGRVVLGTRAVPEHMWTMLPCCKLFFSVFFLNENDAHIWWIWLWLYDWPIFIYWNDFQSFSACLLMFFFALQHFFLTLKWLLFVFFICNFDCEVLNHLLKKTVFILE